MIKRICLVVSVIALVTSIGAATNNCRANTIFQTDFEFQIAPNLSYQYVQRFYGPPGQNPGESIDSTGFQVAVGDVDVFSFPGGVLPAGNAGNGRIAPDAISGGSNYLEVNGNDRGAVKAIINTEASKHYKLSFIYNSSNLGTPGDDNAVVEVSLNSLDSVVMHRSGDGWLSWETTFEALGSPTELRFSAGNSGKGGIMIDNVIVTELVSAPEPTSLALLSIGMIGVGAVTSRRRRK